jgi:AAA domain
MNKDGNAPPTEDHRVSQFEPRNRKQPPKRLVLRLDEFLRQYVAPDYILDGILQRGYLYSATGLTGAGKSAWALLVAFTIAKGGGKIGEREIVAGRIVYICKENPIDIMMRLMAMCEMAGVRWSDIAERFLVIPEIESIQSEWKRVCVELTAFGDVDLIVVDTSIALFVTPDMPDAEENNTAHMYAHAIRLRSLTRSPGRPTVLALCHPTKKPNGAEDLLPRGGGSFLNEMDGNLTLWSIGNRISELHWCGKFRGPGFEPIAFKMEMVRLLSILDSKGRILPTVVARHIADDEIERMKESHALADITLLGAMLAQPKGSMATWATACNWIERSDDPNERKPIKWKVQRALDRLEREKRVLNVNNKWEVTPKGKKLFEEARHSQHASNDDILQ